MLHTNWFVCADTVSIANRAQRFKLHREKENEQ
jgi:hypothetical protein